MNIPGKLPSFLCIEIFLIFLFVSQVSGQFIEKPDDHTLVIFQVSDTHLGCEGSSAFLNSIKEYIDISKHVPDFILHCGDITEDGSTRNYDLLNTFDEAFQFKIHSVPGNSDIRWSSNAYHNFEMNVGKRYFSFQKSGWKFLGLDSTLLLDDSGVFKMDQLVWIENELENTPDNTPIIVFFHHNPGLDVFYGYEYLFKLLKSKRILLILHSGKDVPEYSQFKGIRTISSSGYLGKVPSFNKIELSPDRIKVSIIENQSDSFKNSFLCEIPTDYRLHEKENSGTLKIDRPNRNERISRNINIKTTYYGVNKQVKAGFRFFGNNWKDMKMKGEQSFLKYPIPEEILNGRYLAEIKVDLDNNEQIVKSVPVFIEPQIQIESITSHEYFPYGYEKAPFCKWNIENGRSQITFLELYEDYLAYGTSDNRIIFLDRQNGRIKRKLKLDDNGPEITKPVFAYKAIFIGDTDGNIKALDSRNGKIKWSIKSDAAIYSAPIVEKLNVYFATGDGKIMALDAFSGELNWSVQLPGPLASTPALFNHKLAVPAFNGEIYCLDLHDGKVIWKTKLTELKHYSPFRSKMFVIYDKLYLAAQDQIFYVLHVDSGEMLKSFYAKDLALYMVKKDRIYAFSDNEGLISYDLEGNEEWRSRKNEFSCCPRIYPVETSGRILVPDNKGEIICMVSSTGEILWKYPLNSGKIITDFVTDGESVFAATESGEIFSIQFN